MDFEKKDNDALEFARAVGLRTRNRPLLGNYLAAFAKDAERKHPPQHNKVFWYLHESPKVILVSRNAIEPAFSPEPSSLMVEVDSRMFEKIQTIYLKIETHCPHCVRGRIGTEKEVCSFCRGLFDEMSEFFLPSNNLVDVFLSRRHELPLRWFT